MVFRMLVSKGNIIARRIGNRLTICELINIDSVSVVQHMVSDIITIERISTYTVKWVIFVGVLFSQYS